MGELQPPMAKRLRHQPKLRRVTLADISAACGLPLMTVSRALRGRTREVNAKDLQLAVRTANRLGYRPNLINRALRTGHRQMFGVILPYLDAFTHHLLSGIHDASAASQVQCSVRLVAIGNGIAEAYRAAFLALTDRQVDGVVAMLPADHAALAGELRSLAAERALPLVLVGSSSAIGAVTDVDMDATHALRSLMARLQASAVHQLVLFTGPDHFGRRRKLADGLAAACSAAGVQFVRQDVGQGMPSRRRLVDMIGADHEVAVATTEPLAIPALAEALSIRPGRQPLVVLAAACELSLHGWPLLLLGVDPYACGRSAVGVLAGMAYQQRAAAPVLQVATLSALGGSDTGSGSPLG